MIILNKKDMKKLLQGRRVKIINEKSQFNGQLAIVNETFENRQFVSVIGEHSDTRVLMRSTDLEPVNISPEDVAEVADKIYDKGHIVFGFLDIESFMRLVSKAKLRKQLKAIAVKNFIIDGQELFKFIWRW